jgi:hypothetical protein
MAEHDGSMMGGMGSKVGKMDGKMMKWGKTAQMVAASDGGVIILKRNKLMKYDKDLNLVKEVELKPDEGIRGEKMCAMCAKMMGDKKGDSGKAEGGPGAEDHESHH